MGQSVIYAAGSAPAEPIVSVPVADTCCDLLQLFAGVSDGRVGRGRNHPVAAVLALAAAAVVAGMRGYTAITGWVADVPPAILADLYRRGGLCTYQTGGDGQHTPENHIMYRSGGQDNFCEPGTHNV